MHLIILVHGMWGSPADFNYITSKLVSEYNYIDLHRDRSEAPANKRGYVYASAYNAGYHTYDGVDVCGTRLAREIEHVCNSISNVTEISLVGFSMGAVIIRYAVGVLYTNNFFKKIKPKTLVCTCGPHIGVNMLGNRLSARMFNLVGQYSMARTSKQAFLKDSLVSPLFLRLVKPESPFVAGAMLFNRRVLYAHLVNDKRCEFYTASATLPDDLVEQNKFNVVGEFVKGFNDAILNGSKPFVYGKIQQVAKPSVLLRSMNIALQVVKFGVVLPVWFVCFAFNAVFRYSQTYYRTRNFDLALERQYDKVHDAIASMPPSQEVSLVMERIIKNFNLMNFEKFYLVMKSVKSAHSAAIMKVFIPGCIEAEMAVKHLLSVVA